MANFNTSSNMTATVTVLAAALSMVNLAYDASMINTLLLSNSFVECMSCKFCHLPPQNNLLVACLLP